MKQLKEGGAGGKYRYSFEVIKGSGVYTEGRMRSSYDQIFKSLDFDPQKFRDKRILEIGSADGALAFYLEDQGAKEVVAIDVMDPEILGFNTVHRIRNSKVKHILMSVYDCCEGALGKFDYITFFGVFYHLKYPILAFERLNSICKDGGMIFGGGTLGDSFFYNDNPKNGINLNQISKKNFPLAFSGDSSQINELPYSAFVEEEYNSDTSNWFLPNGKCLDAWLKRTGFKIEKRNTTETNFQMKDAEIKKSSCIFSAQRKRAPEKEFNFKAYVGENYIPTAYDLKIRDEKIKSLENELAQLK